MREDSGIDTLLDLHDQVIEQGRGYWLKIEAWRVEPTNQIPHGIRYALTLHEPSGQRILGYDNAHAVKPPRTFKYAGRILTFDHKHRHRSEKGTFSQTSIACCWRFNNDESHCDRDHVAGEDPCTDAVHRPG